jgi:hypothetical protein
MKRLLCACLLSALAGCPTLPTEPDPPAPSVSVEGPHAIPLGGSVQLVASTWNGVDSAYSWAVGDPAVANVDAVGSVSGLALGETSLRVRGEDTLATTTFPLVVVAEPVHAEPVVVLTGAFYARLGDAVQLTATTVNGTDSGYVFATSDPAVATVSAGGVLAALAPGPVLVSATGFDTAAVGTLGLVVAAEVPYGEAWLGSAHADMSAAAFTHWNTLGAVPKACARCHATPGFLDYLGADGTAAESVDADAPTGTGVTCFACHNAVTATLDNVLFPSGVRIEGLGAEARCMTCHQGRASGSDVDAAIANAGVLDDDTESAALSFVSVHNFPAGATLEGGRVGGGYQYEGQAYDARFRHVPGRDTCLGCHDPHSLEVDVAGCATCHEGVASVEDLRGIRMMASLPHDYDGDGDVLEGVYDELLSVRDIALLALQAYAAERGTPLCFEPSREPYYFVDTDADGACDGSETGSANVYASFTGRSLRAAYNVQMVSADPGAFAHNAKYLIELLHDSAQDLNGALAAPFDLSSLVRSDAGHMDGASPAARRWDGDDAVSASCSRCHGGSDGFRFYVEHGVSIEVLESANGLDCYTCHETFGDDPDPYATLDVGPVEYPSGAVLGGADNLCSTCHAGRASGGSVDTALLAANPAFPNPHYLPAGALRHGVDAHAGYEYPSKSYAGPWPQHTPGAACTYCHDPGVSEHTFDPDQKLDTCRVCHGGASLASTRDIRGVIWTPSDLYPLDYDGDGDADEPLRTEISDLLDALRAAIEAAAAAAGQPMCYSESSYPYWFHDNNPSNGVCDVAERTNPNRYQAWKTAYPDGRLLKAAFNYQLIRKEPGAWAHNFSYAAQLLYDSIEDVGGDVAGLARP